MSIEVFLGEVIMPPIEKRRFRYTANNKNINSYWYIYDTLNNDKRVSKGTFQDIQFRCLYLNKNYYRDLNKDLNKETV